MLPDAKRLKRPSSPEPTRSYPGDRLSRSRCQDREVLDKVLAWRNSLGLTSSRISGGPNRYRNAKTTEKETPKETDNSHE
jgi:hypothetical protein